MRKLCCAFLLAASAAAVDDVQTDLRLLVGIYPGYDEVSYDDGPAYLLDDAGGFTIQVEAVRSYEHDKTALYPWLLAGGVLRFTDATDDQGSDHSVTVLGWELGGGLGVRVSRDVRLELGVVGSTGRVIVGDERLDAVNSDSDSWYAGIEARTGMWYRFNHATAGLVAGVSTHAVLASFGTEADPQRITSNYSGGGAFVLLGFGITLE